MNVELLVIIFIIICIACAAALFAYVLIAYVDLQQVFSKTGHLFLNIFKSILNGMSGIYVFICELITKLRAKRGISPRRAIELRKEKKGYTGIYIIYNATKNMYYVGQGQNVYQRCSNHFLGKGNADIYADYKYGDKFYIRFVSLVESGYDNLDDLESYYINTYDAVKKGYNKKKGNR